MDIDFIIYDEATEFTESHEKFIREILYGTPGDNQRKLLGRSFVADELGLTVDVVSNEKKLEIEIEKT
jgi:hypothetical protein